MPTTEKYMPTNGQMPMELFQYKSLSRTDEIRILVLHPFESSSNEDEIRCELEHVHLSQASEFEALSYVWGDGTKPRRVICDNKTIQVTENLFSALKHLRHGSQSRRIWVDAVCIDQDGTNGNAEKSHQVQMMGDIYAAAEQTIVWLGEDADDRGARAFDLLSEIESYIPLDLDSEVEFRRLVAEAIHPMGYVDWVLDAIDTISVFFEKPWFQRIWIIQEVVKAKRAEVIIGHKGICFDRFQHLLEMMSHDLNQNQERFNVRAWVNLSYIGEMRWHHETRTSEPLSATPWALELLRITEWFQGYSIESDRLYALLSLADYGGFKPDYDLPSSEVFREFAVWALGKFPRLAILSYARGDAETSCPVPSWAPAPRSEGELPYTLLHIDHFQADPGTDPIRGPLFKTIGKFPCLFLTGTIVDTVQETSRVWMNCCMAEDQQEALRSAAKTARCSVSSTLDDKRYARFCLALSFELEPNHHKATSETAARADKFVKAHTQSSLLPNHHPEGDHVSQINHLWQNLARSRHFGRTLVDRFAWVPWTAWPGDKVCIVRGAKVPYVLRQLPHKGMYSLVGECWIQGLMEGEALQLDGFEWVDICLI